MIFLCILFLERLPCDFQDVRKLIRCLTLRLLNNTCSWCSILRVILDLKKIKYGGKKKQVCLIYNRTEKSEKSPTFRSKFDCIILLNICSATSETLFCIYKKNPFSSDKDILDITAGKVTRKQCSSCRLLCSCGRTL